MNIFHGSQEEKCCKCGEPLLLFHGDKVHANAKGSFCSECAKDTKCTPTSVSILTSGEQKEMTCHDCKKTITALQNAYIYDQIDEYAVVCEGCDAKRTP